MNWMQSAFMAMGISWFILLSICFGMEIKCQKESAIHYGDNNKTVERNDHGRKYYISQQESDNLKIAWGLSLGVMAVGFICIGIAKVREIYRENGLIK